MSLLDLFRRKKNREEPTAAIIGKLPSISSRFTPGRVFFFAGTPTNVNHDIHVSVTEDGSLEGLPVSWIRQIGTQITKAEQNQNPEVVKKVLQYYNFSVKKHGVQGQEIKHIFTERDIAEESKEMDLYMKSKDAHKSKESNISSDSPENCLIHLEKYAEAFKEVGFHRSNIFLVPEQRYLQ